MRISRMAGALLTLCLLSACARLPSSDANGAGTADSDNGATSGSPDSAADARSYGTEGAIAGSKNSTSPKPEFVDKVWRVKSPSSAQVGTTYAWLSNGTLVINSSGKMLIGQWQFEDGKLLVMEEGLVYPTEILRLDAKEFHIRSHNPGKAVDIFLEAVPQGAGKRN